MNRTRLIHSNNSRVPSRVFEGDSFTKLLIHGDGADGSTTITDTSASSHVPVAAGHAQVDTAQKKFGTGSLLFDGTGDYVRVPNHADFNVGSGDWTMDYWVRFATADFMQYLGRINGNSPFQGWYMVKTAAGNLNWYTSSNTLRLASSGGELTTNNWHHIAIDSFSGTIRAYINGNSVASWAGTVENFETDLIIGAWVANGGSSLNGWIEEFRWSKGISRYQGSNFTPPTSAYS